ncbi:trypsin-like peptidase domain-containing protein [Vandammella animalimorsus]|uniref:2-alkenal reductase n=1 Tax=Vandammella animalimorsus TaxID=2029117 RepID=A0A2A2AF53_9BURK|nr:trypsin-like peptidase domain-containing protein [Vandammella animalimorsus]PAT36417.1 2-alkenal reductase [Vandammella animalimorsus]
MRRYWLFFSQTVTVMLAGYFIVATLRPQWLADAPATAAPAAQGRLAAPAAPAPAPGAALGPTPAEAGSLRQAAQRAAPSVVSIDTRTTVHHPYANDPFFRYFFGEVPNSSRSGLGSGVIVSADGHLLTNHHVVEGADTISVTLHDGREFSAQVIGSDPDSDLAVLKIQASGLPAIRMGNANAMAIGDTVLAIGNPFGVGQTVTSGIISALGRNHLGLNIFENFIQTDAAINPGNSGGALVNTAGELVGINTVIFSKSGGNMGIGFAIPTDSAQFVLDSVLRNGRVVRGWLGLVSDPLTPELAQATGARSSSGVIVTGVLQHSPAAQAGIRPGDVITAVGDRPVHDVPQLLASVAMLKPQVPTHLTVERAGQAQRISVTPSERPATTRQQRRR